MDPTEILPTEPLNTAPAMQPAALVLGRYRVEQRLGAGGFGVVWRARDERLERPVAVKVLPHRRGLGKRAEREALAAARLNHPAIVTLYEAGSDDTAAYLVSELVEGRALDELLADGALSDRDVARIAAALAGALDHAHAHGVIHRDVKPGNVIVPSAPHGEAALAKLTDFGVARLIGDDPLTRTSDVVGTLAYMAPEQAEGDEVGAAADLYALGLVTYEALTGVNPVRAGGPAATARRLGEPLPPVRRVRRDLPRELATAIDHAVRPHPAERGTVPELGAALSAAVAVLDDEPGTVAASVLEPQVWREPRPALAPIPDAPRGVLGRSRAEHATLPASLRGTPGDGRQPPPVAAGPAEAAVAPRGRRTLPERLIAALGAAGLTALGGLAYPGTLPIPVVALAAVVGVVVFMLPRLGWMVAAIGAIGVAAAQSDGAGLGVGVVLAAAFLPVPFLLWRAPAWWSVGGVAPLLGLAGLAGAFPALAGQAATGWRRAAVGALGAWWVLLAEPLSGRTLLLGHARGVHPRADWTTSAPDAVEQVLRPLATSGAVAIVGLWALAALVLPYLVRGRALAPAALGAAIWTVGLAAGTALVADAVHAHSGTSTAALLGAALAAPLALVATAARARVRPSDALTRARSSR
ncbi:MAG: protein kinase domain-containing protein [Solirubrobacterales bacterium]